MGDDKRIGTNTLNFHYGLSRSISLQIKWHLVCQYTRRGGGVTNLQIKRGKMCLHTEINFSVTLAQVECLQHLNTEQGFFVRWATRATHVWDGQLRLKTKVNFKI